LVNAHDEEQDSASGADPGASSVWAACDRGGREPRGGPVQLFALDSDDEPDGSTLDSVQARWLELRLRTSDAPFRIV
jgi:hypothetical protein